MAAARALRYNSDMVENQVRQRRDQLGLSQKEIAAAIGVSRQSLNAIETGRAVPSVVLALRLARCLGTNVEGLFVAESSQEIVATLAGALPRKRGRVLLGSVRDRWIAHSLQTPSLALGQCAADGFVREPPVSGQARVELARPIRDVSETLFVGGCAPGLGVLADRLNGARGPGRFRWIVQANRSALQALARGHVHLAGVHLPIAGGQRSERALARYLPTRKAAVYALANWDAGLVLPKDNPRQIRGIAALENPRLRVALREPGSGARVQLERLLKRVGLDTRHLARRAIAAASHLEVAHAVALGAADVGFAIRGAALSFELDFVPLVEERFDLVVPDDLAHDARVTRLFETLASATFQRELGELGYDAAQSAQKLWEVAAE